MIGRSRTRLAVAWNTALPIAATTPVKPELADPLRAELVHVRVVLVDQDDVDRGHVRVGEKSAVAGVDVGLGCAMKGERSSPRASSVNRRRASSPARRTAGPAFAAVCEPADNGDSGNDVSPSSKRTRFMGKPSASAAICVMMVSGDPCSRRSERARRKSWSSSDIARRTCGPRSPGFLSRSSRTRLYASGLSSSLRAGVAALDDRVDGVLVCLADMPYVGSFDLDALVAAFAGASGWPIVVPVWGDRRGNPVPWPRAYFPALRALEGDRGARDLLTHGSESILRVPLESDAVLVNVDTPEDLSATRRRLHVSR